MNTVGSVRVATVSNVDTQRISEEALQQAGAEQLPQTTPEQPLFGGSTSVQQLWRMVREFLTVIADATSGTAKESSAAKEKLIEVQRDSQLADLKEREKNLIEQKKAQEANKILSGILFGLSLLIAVITLPFNPVAGAIMIGTLVASVVVPLVVDKILESAGVSQDIRAKVKMGLEIGIALLGAIATLNPAQMLKSLASAGAKIAKSAGQAVVAAVRQIPTALANINWSNVGKAALDAMSKAANKISEMIATLVRTIQTFFKSLASGASATTSKMGAIADKLNDLKVAIQTAAKTALEAMKTAGTAAKEGLKAALEAFKHADELVSSAMAAVKNAGHQFVELMKNVGTKLQTFAQGMRTAPGETLRQMLNDFLDAVAKSASTFGRENAMRVNQVLGVTTGVTGVVQTGFTINSSQITKDTEIASAHFEKINTLLMEVINLLDAATRLFQQALESLSTYNSDYRAFVRAGQSTSQM